MNALKAALTALMRRALPRTVGVFARLRRARQAARERRARNKTVPF